MAFADRMTHISTAEALEAVSQGVALGGAVFTAVSITSSGGKYFVNYHRAEHLGQLICVIGGSRIGLQDSVEIFLSPPAEGYRTLKMGLKSGTDGTLLEIFADRKVLEQYATPAAIEKELETYPSCLTPGENKSSGGSIGVISSKDALSVISQQLRAGNHPTIGAVAGIVRITDSELTYTIMGAATAREIAQAEMKEIAPTQYDHKASSNFWHLQSNMVRVDLWSREAVSEEDLFKDTDTTEKSSGSAAEEGKPAGGQKAVKE